MYFREDPLSRSIRDQIPSNLHGLLNVFLAYSPNKLWKIEADKFHSACLVVVCFVLTVII